MLTLSTFHLGSVVKDGRLGMLAALFAALNPYIILFAPHELPYISVAVLAVIAYSVYLPAVSGPTKNFGRAFVSMLLLLTGVFIHTVIVIFASVIALHFLYITLRYGRWSSRILLVILALAFGIVFYRRLYFFTNPFYTRFINLDFWKALDASYYNLLSPIYLAMPIWILFIAGVLLTFVSRKPKSVWFLNVSLTLLSISFLALTFSVLQFGVSFRDFILLVPLITIVAAYGLLEEVKKYKRDLFFSSILFFVFIVYMANRIPWTIIFPMGVVTLDIIYLTFLPAIFVLVVKVLWKEDYGRHMLRIAKIRGSIRSILLLVLVFVIGAAMVNETVIYVVNPQVGWALNWTGDGLKEAGDWITKNIEPDSITATNAWNHLPLYVDYMRTPIVPLPSSMSSLLRWIRDGKIDYLVILTNTTQSNDITWFHVYSHAKKYADPNQAPPIGTTEYHRGQNFVVFKVRRSYGFSPPGVMGYLSHTLETWALENGYIQLNATRNALLFSYRQVSDYAPMSQIDFENTSVVINGSSPLRLGRWDSIQWFNYTKSDWQEWTETSQPPQSPLYFQQVKVRLSWNRTDFSLFMFETLDKGNTYGQIRWVVLSQPNSVVTIYPLIEPMEKFNRAFIPSNTTTEWSTYSRLAGNPANESMFGLGHMISHTPQVTLSKGNYTGQELPSNIVLPEKTTVWETQMFTYTFNITNEADTDQWVLIEASIPDHLIDQDGDGFYNAGLQSYNVKDRNWWDFARWDAMDMGTDAGKYGPWADSGRATLLNGATLSTALGLSRSDMQGVGLYDTGLRSETVSVLKVGSGPPFDVPADIANITYSSDYGLMKRLAFAIHLPGKKGVGSSSLALRLYLAYNESTSITYEFSSSQDTRYGLGSINRPFMWLYNNDGSQSSIGVIFNKRPSSLSLTVDNEFNFTSVRVGYSPSMSARGSGEFYTNLASMEALSLSDSNKNEIPDTFESATKSGTALFTTLSSLAHYNYTYSQSGDVINLGFEKQSVDNEFNSDPVYTIAVDGRWTWASGGRLLSSTNTTDVLFDVSNASSLSFSLQPRAIYPYSAIVDQVYDAVERTLKIQVASGYLSPEILGGGYIYVLRKITVYTGDMTPSNVYINSKLYPSRFDEANRLLSITIIDVSEAKIDITFAHS